MSVLIGNLVYIQ